MTKHIYLIRNGSLYNLGFTQNLTQTKQKLNPGILEACLETDEAETILRILERNYAEKRLPQSNYYRLSKTQYLECKRQLEKGRSVEDFKPFFSGPVLLISFVTAWISISLLIIRFGIQPIFNQFR